MRQKKLVKWFVMFFAAMLAFTLLSRAADSVNVAKVTLKTVQNQLITHKVSGVGKTEGIREQAVFTRENLQVSQVLVKEGQAVKKGDVLLTLSKAGIREAVQEMEDKKEELTLKIGDLESQSAVEKRKQESDQAWARHSYNLAAQSSNTSVDSAAQEVQIAKERLEEYRRSSAGFSDGSQEEADTERALEDDLRLKIQALNQAVAASSQEISGAQKQMEDASLPQARDSTIENVQRELENTEKELWGLKKLQKRKGAVKAPGDGVVKSLSVATGGMTGTEAAAVLYPTGGELRMNGSISGEEVKYVEIGGPVQVTSAAGKEISGAVLESVTEAEDSSGESTVSIRLPEGSLSIGQTAEFVISSDTGPFSSCVPLSALHEENGTAFVYVADIRETVLGESLAARRVEVIIKDKNETMAALENGSLSSSQRVIVDADREITEGSRVRLQEP